MEAIHNDAAAPAPDQGDAEGVFAAARDELSAAADVAASELRLAGLAIAAMLAMTVLASASLLTAWVMAALGVAVFLLAEGVSLIAVLTGLAVVHVGVALTLWWAIRRTSRHLRIGRFLRARRQRARSA